MALTGKLVGSVEISSGRKVLHDLLRHAPSHNISSISPNKVHSVNLHSGQIGTVGSAIVAEFTLDGKKQSLIEKIEEIDETNHKIVYKIIGGELVEEIYKALKITFHFEKSGGKEWAILTVEFEKPNTSVPDPTSLMDYCCGVLKEMDDHASSK